MGRRKKASTTSTAWQELEAQCLWDEQIAYEIVRPVLLFDQSVAARAAEVGIAPKTVQRTMRQFVQFGIPGLVPTTGHRADDKRHLPLEVRQHILFLKAEYPPLSVYEIATICDLKFGRGSNYRAVQRVLDTEPLPKVSGRRFPTYADERDPESRRHQVIQLWQEGWPIKHLAGYFGIARKTVYELIERWADEGVAGLDDKKRGPKGGTKVPFPVMAIIAEFQRNPLIGEQRMHAKLKQMGYEVSASTCGRIMHLNRHLLHRHQQPPPVKIPKKAMPFLAERRHQWWSVDIRYIERHHVPDIVGPLYVISILDNYSRTILASAPSQHQDLEAYLVVLFAALAAYGAPDGIVSDGGSVFKANKALVIYEALEIIKERIEPRKPWQNFIEAHFGIMRRLADHYLAQATSWEAFCEAHASFIADYNEQDHFAHRERADGLRSPTAVLGWVKGHAISYAHLEDLFVTEAFTRKLDRNGCVQFRYWRLYGNEELAGTLAQVRVNRDILTVTSKDDPLSQYQVTYDDDGTRITEVTHERHFPHAARSPQLRLWALGQWPIRTIRSVPLPHRRPTPTSDPAQLPLFPSLAPARKKRLQGAN
jgi:putative transposase